MVVDTEGCSAGRLIQELQTKATATTTPQSLGAGDAAKLHHLLRAAHFANPDGKHLSPAGEYNLRLGVMKELHPDLIATHQGVVSNSSVRKELPHADSSTWHCNERCVLKKPELGPNLTDRMKKMFSKSQNTTTAKERMCTPQGSLNSYGSVVLGCA